MTPIASSPTEDRDPEIRLRSGADPACPDLLEMRIAIEEQRLPRLRIRKSRPLPSGIRVRLRPALAVVRECDHPGTPDERDIDDVRLERRPHLVADEPDERPEVELRGDRLTDLIDGGQFGHPLAGLGDQAGILERDAQARGDRRQESDIALTEGVLTVEVLEADHASSLVAHDQRCVDDGQGGFPCSTGLL